MPSGTATITVRKPKNNELATTFKGERKKYESSILIKRLVQGSTEKDPSKNNDLTSKNK